MKEKTYYQEIENYIKRNEVNKKRRILEENYDTLTNYWNIGKLLVEAQGGEKRAKYGNELIKKWSVEFTKNYGKGYNITNLKRYRQFYISFSKGAPVAHLSWTNVVIILPIKDINKRNYYINLCIERNLSKRELINEIKSNSYERLIDKAKYVEIIKPKNEISITSNMKDPIIIKLDKNQIIKNEHDLEVTILSQIEFILNQFGKGFCFIGSQYKIDKYFIDMLLFNIEFNSYVVVDLELRSLKKEDKSQTEFYMSLVDKHLNKSHHNKTIGIMLTKEQDKLIANFIKSDSVIPLTYEIQR